MSLFSQFILAFGMSTDAFAASLAKGAQIQKPNIKQIVQAACIFGLVEMIMPVIGWGVGMVASSAIASFDHWIAFILLGGLGVKMVYENLFANDDEDDFSQPENAVLPAKTQLLLLLITAFATSVDSMIVGVSLAFLDVSIWLTALLIGASTALMSAIGLKLGHILGLKAGKYAGVAGGILLIGIGTCILLEHLQILS